MSQKTDNAILPIQLNLNITQPDGDDCDDIDSNLRQDAHGNSSSVPSFYGIPLKYISLVVLAVQNSMLTIIMHYSRVSSPPSRAYSAATAVLLNEILKGTISLIVAFARVESSPSPPYLEPQPGSLWNPCSFYPRVRKLCKDIFSQDCWKLSIPAILYVIQNNLQFVAVSNLEAATFQVSYQMKILTTAGFSVLLLRKRLCSSQWVALLFLAIGVGVVQIQAGSAKVATTNLSSSTDTHTMNATKGFIAVAAACFTSGLAGVYFEMVLKNSQTDLWVRNVQLSLFSLLPALAPVIFSHATRTDGPSGWFQALFRNFGAWAWATVSVQVLGGLVTAMVIKYSDNILKGFATSLSIVISFLASVALFNFEMTFTFILGSVIVLIATWLYNQPPSRTNIIPTAESILGLGRSEKSSTGPSPRRSPVVGPTYTGVPTSPSSPSLESGNIGEKQNTRFR